MRLDKRSEKAKKWPKRLALTIIVLIVIGGGWIYLKRFYHAQTFNFPNSWYHSHVGWILEMIHKVGILKTLVGLAFGALLIIFVALEEKARRLKHRDYEVSDIISDHYDKRNEKKKERR